MTTIYESEALADIDIPLCPYCDNPMVLGSGLIIVHFQGYACLAHINCYETAEELS